MNDIQKRIQALEEAANRCGSLFTVYLTDGKSRRVTASKAIELVKDSQAEKVEAAKSGRGCGELVNLLNDLIGGDENVKETN